MLCNIANSAVIYPLLMLLISAATLGFNFFLSKRRETRYKNEQMSKKADITYVNDKFKSFERETDLKFRRQDEKQEENTALLERIANQVSFIYEKHYKP